MDTGLIAELLLLAQPAEPAEQMRIAAQLRQAAQPREGGAEISEEPAGDESILVHCSRSERSGQGLDVGSEDFLEAVAGRQR